MSFFNLFLTPNQEHQKAFHKVPIISFQRTKGLKDILVRAKVQKMKGLADHAKNRDVKFVGTW